MSIEGIDLVRSVIPDFSFQTFNKLVDIHVCYVTFEPWEGDRQMEMCVRLTLTGGVSAKSVVLELEDVGELWVRDLNMYAFYLQGLCVDEGQFPGVCADGKTPTTRLLRIVDIEQERIECFARTARVVVKEL